MSAADTQIVTLYRQGLSIREVAETLEQPIESVALVVASNCGNGEVATEDITDEEYKRVLGIIKEIAEVEVDNPSARLKAAIYLAEEKKGRNEARVSAGRITKFNVNVINQYLQNSIKKADRIMNGSEGVRRLSDRDITIDIDTPQGSIA